MTTVTISGCVSIVEEFQKDVLWAAFVLKGNPEWKVILKGKPAEEALKTIMSGSSIIASGTLVRFEKDAFKLFATDCMKFENS